MFWLLFIILLLLTLCVLLLGRYTIELNWKSDGNTQLFSVRALPWSGLFNIVWRFDSDRAQLIFRILKTDFYRASGRKEGGKKKDKPDGKKKRRRLSLSLIRSLVNVLPRNIRRLISALDISRGRCHFRLGTRDPAGTGILFGAVYAVQFVLPREFEFYVEPDFSRSVLAGEAMLSIRFTVLRLVGILVLTVIQAGWRRIHYRK